MERRLKKAKKLVYRRRYQFRILELLQRVKESFYNVGVIRKHLGMYIYFVQCTYVRIRVWSTSISNIDWDESRSGTGVDDTLFPERERSTVHPTRISIAYYARGQIDPFAWKVGLLFRKNNSGLSTFASPRAPNGVCIGYPRLTKYLAHPRKEKYFPPIRSYCNLTSE